MESDARSLRKFGITLGVAFVAISGLIYLKRQYFSLPLLIVALAFLASALTIPNALKPVYIIWMKLASVLSWINTRLILCLIFYLVFMPIGLVLRLCGKDLLDRKIQKESNSYWKKKETAPANYERQF